VGIKTQLKAQSQGVLQKLGSPPEGIEEFYHEIPMRDGFKSSLKVFRPTNGGGPLYVLAFGGGFIGGDNDQLSVEARSLVKLLGATVVNISYRVAPEVRNTHPTY
jgi:acetyl esterase/lipase